MTEAARNASAAAAAAATAATGATAVANGAKGAAGGGGAGTNTDQRFFRIPFVRPNQEGSPTKGGHKGWWYAHFDGDWIGKYCDPQQQTL